MHLLKLSSQLVAALAFCVCASATPLRGDRVLEKRATVVKPKVFIIDLFGPEGDIWYGIPEFNLLAQNISVVGLSPLFPEVHCTKDGAVCQVITGESEINAAASITSLVKSPQFDLTATYFLIAGIAGVNPKVGTLGSVAFAKYTIQIALEYEFDAREVGRVCVYCSCGCPDSILTKCHRYQPTSVLATCLWVLLHHPSIHKCAYHSR